MSYRFDAKLCPLKPDHPRGRTLADKIADSDTRSLRHFRPPLEPGDRIDQLKAGADGSLRVLLVCLRPAEVAKTRPQISGDGPSKRLSTAAVAR